MQVYNVNAAGSNVRATRERPDVSGDSASKDIENKIMNAQKQRKELSSNMEMTAAEKVKQRQKIQQEISDLKRELRQRQAEEKRKQQEADRAEKIKEENNKAAFRAETKGQHDSRIAQDTDGKKKNVNELNNGGKEERREAEEERKDMLPGMIHKSLSKESAMNQAHIVANTSAKMERAVRVREAELNQDAARGADVEALKKEHQKEIQKEALRMEQMQTFMLEGGNKADSETGTVKQFSGNVRGKGLYNNSGAMFKTNFQSVQMDTKQ